MCDTETQLLIVDDDAEIRDLLSHYLEKEGFRVFTAARGEMVDKVLSEHRIHLIVLDLMMPGEGGLSVCRRIRAISTIPIIILTAKGEEMDRVVGLEIGADDYITKPFSPRELVARIKAVLWRTAHIHTVSDEKTEKTKLAFSGWIVSVYEREVHSVTGEVLDLSSGEFELLSAFLSNPGKVLSRDQLLDLTQGRTSDPFDRSIDVLVSRLRRKIEAGTSKPRIIKTVRGAGYAFTANIESE